MIWVLFLPFSLLTMLFCYITNPIVCLFADENGELPGFLKYWQTWDDSLNPAFYVKEKAPKCLQYDWDKHYEEYKATTIDLIRLGQDRWYTKCIDPNFTIKERIQRYLCRVLWLTRNCAYGFAFWIYGQEIDCASVKEVNLTKDSNHELRFGWDTSKNILVRPWWFKADWFVTKHLYWCVYLGWKYSQTKAFGKKQGMIANRLAFKVKLQRKW